MNEHDLHNEIMRAIGQLEGKIEEGFKATGQRLDGINGKVQRHDDKISEISNEQANLKGKATAYGAGGAFVLTVLWEIVKRAM